MSGPRQAPAQPAQQDDTVAPGPPDAALLAQHASDPASDEAEVMRWIEDVSDTTGWTA